MNGSTLLRLGALVTASAAAPLALAQPVVMPPPQWTFISLMSGLGMLMVVGILAVIFFNDQRKTRDKLGLVERLVADGKPVPRELLTNEARQLTLPEQYRHDVRRAIAFVCWGLGVAVVFYIVSGGNPRAAAWGLLLIVPGLGNFLKAWLTAREIARGPSDGAR
jgi:hypothetical protein